MFTLKDIEMLPVPEGTRMIIIREHRGEELDAEMKQILAKQVKKALKLPVLFLPYGPDVFTSSEDFSHDYD